MKRTLTLLLIVLLVFGMGTFVNPSLAEPTPSPELSPTPAGTSGSSSVVYQYKSVGEAVVRIQIRMRDLGFFMYKPTGSFQSMTVDSAIEFQKKQTDSNGNPIYTDGAIGPQSLAILFSNRANRADITVDIPFGSTQSQLSVIGELVSWVNIKSQLVVGSVYTIVDCYTGTEFNMIFTGGENHAEMECVTAEGSGIYKELFGGEFNYSKRPVCIKLGSRLIAASLQGEPHGTDTVSNNACEGHSCLYFEGSSSHVGSLPDVEHASQVCKAAGK